METILTLSDAKPNALSTLVERESTLMEQFQQKLTERRQAIQGVDEQQVRLFFCLENVHYYFEVFV